MSEFATISPELRAILDAAEQRIQETGGVPHDEFWRQVDAEYAAAPDGHLDATAEHDLHYQYLVTRSANGRRQPYLKGHNMTVGQLVYMMRANDLNAEEAAESLDLPVAQVREAQAYYETHREAVEADAEEFVPPGVHPTPVSN
jgi:uncharacterized protein (DUF433 family)